MLLDLPTKNPNLTSELLGRNPDKNTPVQILGALRNSKAIKGKDSGSGDAIPFTKLLYERLASGKSAVSKDDSKDKGSKKNIVDKKDSDKNSGHLISSLAGSDKSAEDANQSIRKLANKPSNVKSGAETRHDLSVEHPRIFLKNSGMKGNVKVADKLKVNYNKESDQISDQNSLSGKSMKRRVSTKNSLTTQTISTLRVKSANSKVLKNSPPDIINQIIKTNRNRSVGSTSVKGAKAGTVDGTLVSHSPQRTLLSHSPDRSVGSTSDPAGKESPSKSSSVPIVRFVSGIKTTVVNEPQPDAQSSKILSDNRLARQYLNRAVPQRTRSEMKGDSIPDRMNRMDNTDQNGKTERSTNQVSSRQDSHINHLKQGNSEQHIIRSQEFIPNRTTPTTLTNHRYKNSVVNPEEKSQPVSKPISSFSTAGSEKIISKLTGSHGESSSGFNRQENAGDWQTGSKIKNPEDRVKAKEKYNKTGKQLTYKENIEGHDKSKTPQNLELTSPGKTENISKTGTLFQKVPVTESSNGGKPQTAVHLNHSDIVRELKMTLSAGKSEIILHLKPAVLGRALITLRQTAEGLKLQFNLEHPEARQAVEAEVAQLKESLSAAGIQTASIEVKSSDSSAERFNQAQNDSGRNKQQSGHRHQGHGQQRPEERLRRYRDFGYNTFEVAA